jgi:antitoxin component of RelBE/YafQ-DinJ toxin-antitoxin module
LFYDILHYKIIEGGAIDMQSQITIRLSNELVNETSAIARKLHLKRSDVVRIALEKLIDEFGSEDEIKPYEKIKELTASSIDRVAEKNETYGRHTTIKKLNDITIDDSLFKETKVIADELKIPQNQLFAMALKDFLNQYENKLLLEKINEAYSDAPDPEEQELLQRMKNSHRRLVEGEW